MAQPLSKNALLRKLREVLLEKGLTLSVAESCTGGTLAKELTNLSGASHYFLGGIIAYANQAKVDLLSVPKTLIDEKGAVSEPVAKMMAEQVKELFHSNIGISTTGISGPTGARPHKPVGTVYIALALPKKTMVKRFCFTQCTRLQHQNLTALTALRWLLRSL